MANNDQKNIKVTGTNPAPNTDGQPNETPEQDNRTWLGKLRDGVVEFGLKHPKLTRWGKRIGKVGCGIGLVYGGYKIGQRHPVENVPVVTITSGNEDTETETEPNELSEEKVWEE